MMNFYISDTFTSGSGQEFNNKEDFLKELSLMIDDCAANGGKQFDITVDTDASCFANNDECPHGGDIANDCEGCANSIGNYEVCVMNMETYSIKNAKSKEEALLRAVDCFKDDDAYYGSVEAENVTVDDCEVVFLEEI